MKIGENIFLESKQTVGGCLCVIVFFTCISRKIFVSTPNLYPSVSEFFRLSSSPCSILPPTYPEACLMMPCLGWPFRFVHHLGTLGPPCWDLYLIHCSVVPCTVLPAESRLDPVFSPGLPLCCSRLLPVVMFPVCSWSSLFPSLGWWARSSSRTFLSRRFCSIVCYLSVFSRPVMGSDWWCRFRLGFDQFSCIVMRRTGIVSSFGFLFVLCLCVEFISICS